MFGAKRYSRSDDMFARPSTEVTINFFASLGYDHIGESPGQKQKHSILVERKTGKTLLVASEMRFLNYFDIWNGMYEYVHLPYRKDGMWFDKFVSVGPGKKHLFVIDAVDIPVILRPIDTYCSKNESFWHVHATKIPRFLETGGVWSAKGKLR